MELIPFYNDLVYLFILVAMLGVKSYQVSDSLVASSNKGEHRLTLPL